MHYEKLRQLTKSKRWNDLEAEWLSVVDNPQATPDHLLPVIDAVVEAGKINLAETLGWAWLSSMKENLTPREALQLGRGLLLRLPDGDDLRDEILALYKQTHDDRPDLEKWIDRSGLKSGKSVRRALRYLDMGLKLTEGCYLLHRSEDKAAHITHVDFEGDAITLREAHRERSYSMDEIISEYDLADENDFIVMQQLNPDRIGQIIEEDPIALVMGILRCHSNQIDRDQLKLMLVPRHLAKDAWSDWWAKVRNGIKKTPHLRLEGRSPMFLIFDPVGQTPEEEAWSALSSASKPRQWLDILERYLRDGPSSRKNPDGPFWKRVEAMLIERSARFARHGDSPQAFATALILKRLSDSDITLTPDSGDLASRMLKTADHAVALAGAVDDILLWKWMTRCVEQSFPDQWPEMFAELILSAPGSLCDVLARRVEEAEQGYRLTSVVDRVLADPGRYTDAVLWIWNGPKLKNELPTPPRRELFSLILALVGPSRLSEGKAKNQTVIQMRTKVRAGLSSRDYASFRKSIESIDISLAQTIRRQIERAEGLGPSAQDEMLSILSRAFPNLYVKAEVPIWEDDSVYYFTREGLKTREAERDELVNVKMRENAKAIGAAAEHGDLSENSEYKFALEERDLLRARLAQINRELSIAKILEPDAIPTDHISIGQRITLRPPADAEPLVVSILGFGDSDIGRQIFAYQTPLAKQLLGKRPGDTVSLSLGDLAETHYEIADIQRAIE